MKTSTGFFSGDTYVVTDKGVHYILTKEGAVRKISAPRGLYKFGRRIARK